jgi:hypothetical protein
MPLSAANLKIRNHLVWDYFQAVIQTIAILRKLAFYNKIEG